MQPEMTQAAVVPTRTERCAQLQPVHDCRNTETWLYTGQMPFLSPIQQCQSTEGNVNTENLFKIKRLGPMISLIHIWDMHYL